jgi:hypothetical protein
MSRSVVEPLGRSHSKRAAGDAFLPRAAARYWLLQFEDDELRFTHRAGAERWAARLAARGIPSQLTRHDEHSATDAPNELQVA